jgi:hypothetical protein
VLAVSAALCAVGLSAGTSAQMNPAAPAGDATRFVTAIIDKFNGGDTKSWLSAQEDNTSIVDEFAPHAWSGSGSPQRWLDAYVADSKTNGVSQGRIDYGRPLTATSDGKTAYIVLPTTYRFVQKGIRMAEPGSMTFVVNRSGAAWKIASWTYSAAAPAAPDKGSIGGAK